MGVQVGVRVGVGVGLNMVPVCVIFVAHVCIHSKTCASSLRIASEYVSMCVRVFTWGGAALTGSCLWKSSRANTCSAFLPQQQTEELIAIPKKSRSFFCPPCIACIFLGEHGICICIHIFMHICKYVYVSVCVSIYICMYLYTYTHVSSNSSHPSHQQQSNMSVRVKRLIHFV